MDDTREFLKAVVAWDIEGYTAICWQKPGGKWCTKFCATLDEAVAFIDKLKSLECNIYFSLARFEVAGERTRENALALQSIFVDVDVEAGKPEKYESLDKALEALLSFC